MKIFYQLTDRPQELLDENSTSLEELVIPEPALEEFGQTLKESTEILPQSARTFQEWQVGLLDRYESHPIGAMDMNFLAQKVSPKKPWPAGIKGIEGLQGIEGLL